MVIFLAKRFSLSLSFDRDFDSLLIEIFASIIVIFCHFFPLCPIFSFPRSVSVLSFYLSYTSVFLASLMRYTIVFYIKSFLPRGLFSAIRSLTPVDILLSISFFLSRYFSVCCNDRRAILKYRFRIISLKLKLRKYSCNTSSLPLEVDGFQ